MPPMLKANKMEQNKILTALVAHPDAHRRQRVQATLSRLPQLQVKFLAEDLSETFHITEHRVPDIAFVHESLAILPEFEVLHALFLAIDVRCIILNTDRITSFSAGSQELTGVSEQDNHENVLRALKLNGSQNPQMPRRSGRPPGISEFDDRRIILIGSSTGGVDALLQVLSSFPPHAPPTLIVQHTGGEFIGSLARLLSRCTNIRIKMAEDGEALAKGCVYLSPSNDVHLALKGQLRPIIGLDTAPRVSGHRPSVDQLFRSALPFARNVSAAILTGMGRDGAQGLLQLRAAGASTIAQDSDTSVVYGMPRVAFEIGAAQQQLALQDIGPALLDSCKPDRDRQLRARR
jgi:two-component system chemotaxis response regulator CheB